MSTPKLHLVTGRYSSESAKAVLLNIPRQGTGLEEECWVPKSQIYFDHGDIDDDGNEIHTYWMPIWLINKNKFLTEDMLPSDYYELSEDD